MSFTFGSVATPNNIFGSVATFNNTFGSVTTPNNTFGPVATPNRLFGSTSNVVQPTVSHSFTGQPVEIKTIACNYSLFQEYSAEWKIININSMKHVGVKTPPFYPIPNCDIKFGFEIWFKSIQFGRQYTDSVSLMKITLLKISESEISECLKIKLFLSVNYGNDKVYKNYDTELTVKDMNFPFTCIDDKRSFYENQDVTEHYINIAQDTIILKCRMVFYDHLASPSKYYDEIRTTSSLKAFANNFKTIFESNEFSDVVFKFNDQTLPAHKLILASHSPVFKKMFEVDMLESKNNSIKIKDYDINVFQHFLKYLYTAEIEDLPCSILIQLYKLAHKYDIRNFLQVCAYKIVDSLDKDNIYRCLKFAYDFNDEYLKIETKKFVVCRYEELSSTEHWNELVTTDPIIGYEVLVLMYSEINSSPSSSQIPTS